MLFLAQVASAQITIDDDGRVAIVGNTTSSDLLNIECDGCLQTTYGYGIYIDVEDVSVAYGVKAIGNSNQYNSYGVYGVANSTSSSNNYAIYGIASGSSGENWAGRFVGDVYSSSGQWDGSDERFKDDIQALNGPDMLDRIQQLQPRKYRYRTEEELEQAGMPTFSSKDGYHFGVIAQELETILPELVIDTASLLNDGSEFTDESGEEETVMTKAVNYNGLIPVLIAGIQEQQAQIDDLEARIEMLETMMQE